jgi:hypothetical protein
MGDIQTGQGTGRLSPHSHLDFMIPALFFLPSFPENHPARLRAAFLPVGNSLAGQVPQVDEGFPPLRRLWV